MNPNEVQKILCVYKMKDLVHPYLINSDANINITQTAQKQKKNKNDGKKTWISINTIDRTLPSDFCTFILMHLLNLLCV